MVDFTREEVEAAIEEYASTLIEEEEDEFIDDEEENRHCKRMGARLQIDCLIKLRQMGISYSRCLEYRKMAFEARQVLDKGDAQP